MTGHISEERLALYAGGDLPPDEAANAEVHLESCRECQLIAGEYRQAQKTMAASVQDPDPEELRELREGIAARLNNGPRRVAAWAWVAAAAAALVLSASLYQGASHLVKTTRPAAAHTQVPETVWLNPALPTPHLETAILQKRRTRREPGIRTVALLTRPDEPSFIKMTTSDPNVVILWQPTERIQ